MTTIKLNKCIEKRKAGMSVKGRIIVSQMDDITKRICEQSEGVLGYLGDMVDTKRHSMPYVEYNGQVYSMVEWTGNSKDMSYINVEVKFDLYDGKPGNLTPLAEYAYCVEYNKNQKNCQRLYYKADELKEAQEKCEKLGRYAKLKDINDVL